MTCIYRNVTAFKLGSVMGSPAIMVTEAGKTYVETYRPQSYLEIFGRKCTEAF